MLDSLVPGIQDRTLSPQDRFNVQTDVFALARAGHVSCCDYLKLLRQAYKHEDNLTVWKSIVRQLAELNSIFNYATIETTKELYQAFVCDLLSIICNKLDWDPMPNEGSQAVMLRSLVLIEMGVNQHHRTCDEARKRFVKLLAEDQSKDDEHAHHPHTINPNVRAAIYIAVAKAGNQQTFDQLTSVRTGTSGVHCDKTGSIQLCSSIAKPIRKKNAFAC